MCDKVFWHLDDHEGNASRNGTTSAALEPHDFMVILFADMEQEIMPTVRVLGFFRSYLFSSLSLEVHVPESMVEPMK